MTGFAIVALMPEDLSAPGRLDFVSQECETIEGICEALRELDLKAPKWRIVSFCHVEDLPLLMEAPPT